MDSQRHKKSSITKRYLYLNHRRNEDSKDINKKDGVPRPSREVSVHGRARSVHVHWDGRAPSRAAAALLATALRHALRYRRVELAHTAETFCNLVIKAQWNCHVLEYSNSAYDKVIVSPAMAWSGRRCLPIEFCQRAELYRDRWVAEPRLAAEGMGAAGATGETLRLHVHLTKAARAINDCAQADSWTFYTDLKRLQLCEFTKPDKSQSLATVYVFTEESEVIYELKSRIDTHTLHLNITLLELDAEARIKLLALLQERTSSFLFLDYDLWNGMDGVVYVTLPPPAQDTVPTTLDLTRSVRVADDFVLRQIAPSILETLHHFSPSLTDLGEILKLEVEQRQGIEDAACAWALNNTSKFNSYQMENKLQYWVAVFLCNNDSEKEKYKTVASIYEEMYRKEPDFDIRLHFVEIDCRNEDQLNEEYIKTFLSYKWQKLIGVVAAGVGMEAAAETAPVMETALVFYDVPSPRVRLGASARAASGSVRHLAIAMQHFLNTYKWKRLALLSDNSQLAKGLREALDNGKLALYDTTLLEISSNAIRETLQRLRNNKNAKVIFINTNADIGEIILCEAHDLGMTVRSEFAWIVRERRSAELKCSNMSLKVNHFTISFWWRGGDDAHLVRAGGRLGGTGEVVRKKLSELWKGASWPTLAAPLADSLQLLIESFKEFSKKYPNKFFDLHGMGTCGLLLESLDNQVVNGIVQQLQYINGTIAKPLVFVDLWKNDQHESLFHWRIKNDFVEPVVESKRDVYDGVPPSDGMRYCVTFTTGDPFLPRCHDVMLLTSTGVIFTTVLALYVARRVRLSRLACRDAILKAQLLARTEFVTNALVDHYVDRAALELYHDLGNGCFGRVRYGILRAPDRPPVSVAVKEVRDEVSPAEESELLREACTIAALRHDHVVRLIGVCTTGRPLLVLMEYAFFGDLREYLSERRHLAERISDGVDKRDESYHISSVSLTRLAKQAACALEYLSQERLVHRDVRASNCLVDARRTLKLADFGLARKTEAGSGGEGEYSCRRRGLFPVLWMAPESLERGVFTAASDAWALGVLLLELVTLGARPYGAWPPLRVLRYVSAGGRPPLPEDATPDTRRILGQCWRSSPEERLTAAALVALLDASPAALEPALRPVDSPPDEACPDIDIAPEQVV